MSGGGSGLGRMLMVVGALIFLTGVVVASGGRIPLGRLPGDIVMERGSGTFYFPIVTCLLVSAFLSLVFWLLRR